MSESRDVLEALRFIPKGCQTVAGGRSAAETTGMVRNEDRILEGCQKRGNVFRRSSRSSGIPAGCTASFRAFRGSPLCCDSRLFSDIPFGMNRKPRIKTVRFWFWVCQIFLAETNCLEMFF